MKNKLAAAFAAAFIVLLMYCALAETAVDITKKCEFKAASGNLKYIVDDSPVSSWIPEADKPVFRVKLPEGGAGHFRLRWQNETDKYIYRQYDADMNVISELNGADVWQGIDRVFDVEPNAVYLEIELTAKAYLSEVNVYSSGTLPEKVPNFEPPHEKVDLMVVSAHQDDEWLWFSGIMPLYENVAHRKVQLVYMTDCNVTRRHEGVTGAWWGKVHHYPIFLNYKDEQGYSNDIIKDWGGRDKVIGDLVALIRKTRPEVVLTHDIEGEYGHPQHILTSKAWPSAITAAAEPDKYPESAALYGTWQVKKFYRHLADDHGYIRFDFSEKYDELGGLSPFDCAERGYSAHVSQHSVTAFHRGGSYDNTVFGLAGSTVGPDEKKNDLFEHITDEMIAAEPPRPEPVQGETTPEPQEQEPVTEGDFEDIEQPDETRSEDGSDQIEPASGTGQPTEDIEHGDETDEALDVPEAYTDPDPTSEPVNEGPEETPVPDETNTAGPEAGLEAVYVSEDVLPAVTEKTDTNGILTASVAAACAAAAGIAVCVVFGRRSRSKNKHK